MLFPYVRSKYLISARDHGYTVLQSHNFRHAFLAEGTPIGKEVCEIISKYFNNLLITDQGLNDSGFVSGRVEILYSSKDHALISTIKFLDEISKAMKPTI